MGGQRRSSNETVVVVTGSGRGFGRLLVVCALASGARVVSVSRSIPSRPVLHPQHTFLVADCGHDAEVGAFWLAASDVIQSASRLILINNAGYYLKRPLHECTDSDVMRTLDSNIAAAVNVTRRMLLEDQLESIVNIVSTSALQFTVPGSDLRNKAIYAGSKRVLAALVENLTLEIPSNVRLLNVYPRNINTWSSRREPDSIIAEELADWIVHWSFGETPWHIAECTLLPVV